MTGKTVQVQFQSKIFQDEGDESFDIQAKGRLVEKGDALYLTYDEEIAEQPVTKVMVKMEEGRVAISRSNVNKTRLVFEPGLLANQPYQTAAGMMLLDTNTRRFELDLADNKESGKLLLDYSLAANGEVVGQYQVSLQFS